MGPKKKKGKSERGKKKKQNSETAEEERMKKAQNEIEALKDNLAFRKEFSRRSKAAYEEMKSRIDEKSAQVEDAESMHKSANAYLTHQYKSLQTDMSLRLQALETELGFVKKQLDDTTNALTQSNLEKKRIIEEKDEKISELDRKIHNIEVAYDSVVQTNLNTFIENLNRARSNWEAIGASIQVKNKMLLAELGLNVHDI